MTYLIDTDLIIDHLEEAPTAMQLLRRLADDGISISMVTYMEVFQGVERSAHKADAQAKLQALLAGVPVLPFSFAVAERCARLRETLRKQRKRVHSRALDLINAATALEYGLVFVTRNVDDYKDLPGLKLYQGPLP
jgi:predicted nucleic acid-binding protein